MGCGGSKNDIKQKNGNPKTKQRQQFDKDQQKIAQRQKTLLEFKIERQKLQQKRLKLHQQINNSRRKAKQQYENGNQPNFKLHTQSADNKMKQLAAIDLRLNTLNRNIETVNKNIQHLIMIKGQKQANRFEQINPQEIDIIVQTNKNNEMIAQYIKQKFQIMNQDFIQDYNELKDQLIGQVKIEQKINQNSTANQSIQQPELPSYLKI